MLIRFIQRNQGRRDSVMHEFHSNVNKVNKAVAKVRTIGDRLPLTMHKTNIEFILATGETQKETNIVKKKSQCLF